MSLVIAHFSGLMMGFGICFALSLIQNYYYKSTLKIKAIQGELEKIQGIWIRLKVE